MAIYYFTTYWGCYERSYYAVTRERGIQIAERWASIFWDRYVRETRRKHPGSIAAATLTVLGKPTLTVRQHGPLDSAGIIPWESEIVYERDLPMTEG